MCVYMYITAVCKPRAHPMDSEEQQRPEVAGGADTPPGVHPEDRAQRAPEGQRGTAAIGGRRRRGRRPRKAPGGLGEGTRRGGSK